MDRNNNSNKNIKLTIKSSLEKVSLQVYFKRVNVPTVSKARWQSIPYCWSSMEKGSITKSLPCHLRDYKQCFRIRLQAVYSSRLSKLKLINENQIYRQLTICGQN